MIFKFFRTTGSLVFLLQSCNRMPPQNIDLSQKKPLTYVNGILGYKKTPEDIRSLSISIYYI
jgi:hypothetical protein